jgi:sulfur-oxidizing protein SoxZ
MAQQLIKIRATLTGDRLDLRTLSTHPMETGQRKDGAGQLVPAHFIQRFSVTLNGKAVVQAETSQALSTNPNLGFRIKGAKAGDQLVVAWEDNKGQQSSETLVLA